MGTVDARTQILHSKKDGNYLGVYVDSVHLEPYLEQLRTHLGDEEFERCSRMKQGRDGANYHVTALSPFERGDMEPGAFQALVSRSVSLDLSGLGRVSADEREAFFVIVSSADLESLREEVGLAPIGFHVTLGFRGADVHGVPKGAAIMVWRDGSSTSPKG